VLPTRSKAVTAGLDLLCGVLQTLLQPKYVALFKALSNMVVNRKPLAVANRGLPDNCLLKCSI
jgi:hypothetical protein